MGTFETIEQWAWQVAVKKVIAALIGFLASQKAIAGIAWMEAHGVHLDIDVDKFQTQMTLLGIAIFAALHDWLKLRFPETKWL